MDWVCGRYSAGNPTDGTGKGKRDLDESTAASLEASGGYIGGIR